MNLDDALKCLAESFQPGMTSVRSNKSIQNQQEAELAEGESVMTGVF